MLIVFGLCVLERTIDIQENGTTHGTYIGILAFKINRALKKIDPGKSKNSSYLDKHRVLVLGQEMYNLNKKYETFNRVNLVFHLLFTGFCASPSGGNENINFYRMNCQTFLDSTEFPT